MTATTPYSRYSPHESAILNQHYNSANRETLLALLPGRTWRALCMQAQRAGIADRPYDVRCPSWSAASEALMLQLYPTHGGKHMAALLGRTLKTVFQKAQRMQLRFVGKPKPPKPEKPPKPPKAANPPKPPKPAPAPKPVKQPKVKASSPRLVNHTMQKAMKERSEKARSCDVVFTADEIRKRPLTDPIRLAYQSNGDRGVRAYLQTLNAAA